MKVLFLSQGHRVEDQPDFDFALRHATSGGRPIEFRNIPYRGLVAEHGWDWLYREILRVNEEFLPDLVIFQFFHEKGNGGIVKCCMDLKASKNHPLIFCTIGDLFYTGWRRYFAKHLPDETRRLVTWCDAIFPTSMGAFADELVRLGGKNIVFLPHAFCPAHFPDWETFDAERTSDVVMVGSKGALFSRRFLTTFGNTWQRKWVVRLLRARYGRRFSIYGKGWPVDISKGYLPFDEQVHAFARAGVAVDSPAPTRSITYYGSDRPFFILGSGTPLVHFHTPRFEKMMRPDEHAFYVTRIRDVCAACKKALALPADVRDERRRRIRAFVKERHLISHRIDTILSTAEALLKCRRGEIDAATALRSLRLWHFLPEVNLKEEKVYSIANWQG